jgi:hypothetical protein
MNAMVNVGQIVRSIKYSNANLLEECCAPNPNNCPPTAPNSCNGTCWSCNTGETFVCNSTTGGTCLKA